jgi:molybdate transport system substrate-binding protein
MAAGIVGQVDPTTNLMESVFAKSLLAALVLATALAPLAEAADIKVFSGNGARAAVLGLTASFDRATGNKTTVEIAVNPETRAKILAGQAFDVAVLNPPVLDDLIKRGRIVAETRAVIGRAGIGVAMREGAPRPDISTVEAFKRTLLSANSVVYPVEGASGRYFASLVQRLGIAAEMKPRMRPMPGEYNVEMVATGEADLAVSVASRISGVPGVQLVGMIPQELQTWIGFTAGLSSHPREPEAARAMLRFFTSSEAARILKANGVEPFVE